MHPPLKRGQTGRFGDIRVVILGITQPGRKATVEWKPAVFYRNLASSATGWAEKIYFEQNFTPQPPP